MNGRAGSKRKETTKSHPIIGLVVIVFVAFSGVVFYNTLKELQRQTEHPVSIPWNLEDLKKLNEELGHLQESKYSTVLLFFCSFYILKQTFCLPGSFWLNIWAGNLFGILYGFPLVCVLTSLGASCCYWISHFLFRGLIVKCFPQKLIMLQKKVDNQKEDLFWFLILLRIVPFTPNWLLNLLSPIVDVPFNLFWISILIGLMPYNFIAVQTGTILSDMGEKKELFDMWTVMKLLSIAVVYLGFILVKNRMSKKIEYK
jgi:uncharacterized membrane protein YdjX (TVP38/TMEM64 family)